jgi:hypothetical protein
MKVQFASVFGPVLLDATLVLPDLAERFVVSRTGLDKVLRAKDE